MEKANICKLFVANIKSTTDDNLRRYYQKWGDVKSATVIRDYQTGQSRGFAYVTYSNPSGVDRAMANRPHTINGVTLDPKRVLPRDKHDSSARYNSTRMFVTGIGKQHTRDALIEYFSDFGHVIDVKICADQEGTPSYCILKFDDYDAVDKCILWGTHFCRDRKLFVEKAPYDEKLDKVKKATCVSDKPKTSMNPQKLETFVTECRNQDSSCVNREYTVHQGHATRRLDFTNFDTDTWENHKNQSSSILIKKQSLFDRQPYENVDHRDKVVSILAIRVRKVILEDGKQKPKYEALVRCDDWEVKKIEVDRLWDMEPMILGQAFEKLCTLKQIGDEFRFEY